LTQIHRAFPSLSGGTRDSVTDANTIRYLGGAQRYRIAVHDIFATQETDVVGG
jgi:hypothetical protein